MFVYVCSFNFYFFFCFSKFVSFSPIFLPECRLSVFAGWIFSVSCWNSMCPAQPNPFRLIICKPSSTEEKEREFRQNHLNHHYSHKKHIHNNRSSSYSTFDYYYYYYSRSFEIAFAVAVAFFALPELISRIYIHSGNIASNANDCTTIARHAYRLL